MFPHPGVLRLPWTGRYNESSVLHGVHKICLFSKLLVDFKKALSA